MPRRHRPWRLEQGRLHLRVRATPRAARDTLDGMRPTAQGVALEGARARRAEDGEANAAVERCWRAGSASPRRTWRSPAGGKSRIKTVAVAGDAACSEALVAARVRELGTSDRNSSHVAAQDHRRQGDRRSAAPEVARERGQVSKRARGLTPGLAVVLVGEDPASQVYVRNKAQATREAGMALVRARAAARYARGRAAGADRRLNADADVHGILVQLPLPAHIDAATVIEADRSGQGRRRLPSRQRRPAGDRRAGRWRPARRRAA